MKIMKRVLTSLLLANVAVGAPPEVTDQIKTVRFEKRRLFVSTYQAANVADINRDGKPDIVSGPYWFAAPNFEPHSFRANEAADNYLHSNSDLPYDVDGDGWVDVIVGAWGPEGIVWF
ncbi:MAG: FG-GAP repeat domain-containing protein, partial [Bryobacteraceae bacterium]